MEARLILGTMVQRLNVRIEDDYALEKEAVLSLHPKGGLPGVVDFVPLP